MNPLPESEIPPLTESAHLFLSKKKLVLCLWVDDYNGIMKLSELVSEDLILTELKSTDVSGVLREFAEAISTSGKFSDPELLHKRLLEREKQESTGIGNAVAIPHCKLENLQEVVLAIGYSQKGVWFGALDNKPTHFFFLVISPANASVQHLRTLAALSKLLKTHNFLARLWQWPGKKELIALIREMEQGAALLP